MMPVQPVTPGSSLPSGLYLFFAPGDRPDTDAIASLIDGVDNTPLSAQISHRPAGEAGWLELLASGLTFDLIGLRPGEGGRMMDAAQSFGFTDAAMPEAFEVVELVPSGHIVSGAGLVPILRTMMNLAANLVLELPVLAVGWGPAQTRMEPAYFCRSVLNWLGGGPFPALGLTGLVRAEDGSVTSRGLTHFMGQEIQLQGLRGESAADSVKIAMRVIDQLVRRGRIDAPMKIDAGGQTLLAEPSQIGRLVLLWRENDG
ncbi:hypothetical protein A8V01_04375 [Novosphingobium guangzhouense]|uniref:DUF4261 domain-containing protein n=2 Tax=Novosphingobium guangzhouense TaxID=1850347 RepID=A0A2K2G287_9SPHN|nr:hypothetical protein A8V01_04375 [Novosphingobium guangzhouense]